ncbi:MAG TPA: hypothetical protein VGD13_09110 [Xanthobacteraceae bacterium]|jgi:hypothetical protein
MGHFSKYVVGGFAAVLAMHYFAAPAGNGLGALSQALSASPANANSFLQATNHRAKSDRLQAVRASDAQSPTIHTVEVVGLRDAAIIYRDRDGTVLYRTDPISNVTVVSKNLTLPEVTIKETPRTSVQRVPAVAPTTLQERKHKVGCDPAFSPVASPSLSNLTGRCMVELKSPIQMASLN